MVKLHLPWCVRLAQFAQKCCKVFFFSLWYFPRDAFFPFVCCRSMHTYDIQWLRANGCPWDTSACYEAAIAGRLDILEVGYRCAIE